MAIGVEAGCEDRGIEASEELQASEEQPREGAADGASWEWRVAEVDSVEACEELPRDGTASWKWRAVEAEASGGATKV